MAISKLREWSFAVNPKGILFGQQVVKAVDQVAVVSPRIFDAGF
jgi:hypothetical protein